MATPVSEVKKDAFSVQKELSGNSIFKNIESNLNKIKQAFNYPENKDIVLREIVTGGKIKAFIAFVDGMVDRITINNFILGL